MTREQAIRAAKSAVLDEELGHGSYYSGPATPVYLAVRAALSATLPGGGSTANPPAPWTPPALGLGYGEKKEE